MSNEQSDIPGDEINTKWEQIEKAAVEDEKGVTPGELQSIEVLEQQLEMVKKESETMQRELLTTNEQLLRLQASFQNLERQSRFDIEEAHRSGLKGFVSALLPACDALGEGLKSVEDELAQQGMTLTLKILNDALVKFGVEIVDPMHQPFDPDRHQAISKQSSDAFSSNIVVGVMQKGYLLNGRMVRPAMVIVSE